MHRHVYKGKKLSLQAGPRRALLRGMIDSLILYERIETTEVRAKALAPQFERLVTKAKKGDLHNARQVMSVVSSPIAGEKLLKELVIGFKDRNGGYTRIVKTGNRRGDNASMAVIELILPADFDKQLEQISTKSAAPSADKAVAEKSTVNKSRAKVIPKSDSKQVAKKEGTKA